MEFEELYKEFKDIHKSKYMDTPDYNHLKSFYEFTKVKEKEKRLLKKKAGKK